MRMHKRILIFLVTIIVLVGTTPLSSYGETFLNGASSFDSLWERMIGSLQLQPLAHAIFCHWTEKSEADAARAIYFERSDDPYSFVFPEEGQSEGDIYPNLLFVPEPYDQWYGDSEKIKITHKDLAKNYEVIPIARDALIFLVNSKNPVNNLSIEQLQDIYMGRLTSWSDLGGVDAQIEAFQSRPNSLSQDMIENTLMLHMIMSNPPIEWKHSARGWAEIVSTNASYNNSETALGYTMHFYTRSMFEIDKTKCLSVNGISPSDEAIISGEYPLTTYYYAIFPKSTPSDDPIRALVKWLLTKEGQHVVKSAGLIPMDNFVGEVDFSLPYPIEKTSQSSGTGGTQDRNAESSEYSDRSISKSGYSDAWGWSDWDSVTVNLPENLALQSEIDTWCQNTRHYLRQSVSIDADISRGIEEHAFVYGNLVSFHFSIASGVDSVIRTAVFDMRTGRQLQLSDLFIDNFNYIEYINRFLLSETYQESRGELGDFGIEEQYLKRPFSGLPADYPHFVVSQDGTLLIAFEGMNPFFHVPYNSVFFAEVPLWHDISPWGGCKIEEMYSLITNDAKHTYCYKLNLRIDEGLSQIAEHKVNEKLKSITDRFLLSNGFQKGTNEKGQKWICMPYLEEYGDYHSFVYIVDEDTFFLNPQTIGGTIMNLHTGEEMLTEEQAKSLAGIPGAAILHKDVTDADWETAQSMDVYSASARATVCAMWLEAILPNNENDQQEMHVVVEIQEAEGLQVRISVPINSVGLEK